MRNTLAVISMLVLLSAAALAQPRPVEVLVVTGGHDFEREPFKAMMDAIPAIKWTEVVHPDAHQYFKREKARPFRAIVFYDMPQAISEEARGDLLSLLDGGVGFVFLHHSIASYQDWPEFRKILGGRFRIAKSTVNGVEIPPSTYQHGVTFKVNVADPRHPITRGVSDFRITDETYGDFQVEATVKPLLTTTEPTSGSVIGWTHTVRSSRVVYLALGHDHTAYENSSFRKLLEQAIRWSMQRARATDLRPADPGAEGPAAG